MWKDLTLRQRAQLIQMGVKSGIGSANTIRKLYDEQHSFANGGNYDDPPVDDDKVFFTNYRTFADLNRNNSYTDWQTAAKILADLDIPLDYYDSDISPEDKQKALDIAHKKAQEAYNKIYSKYNHKMDDVMKSYIYRALFQAYHRNYALLGKIGLNSKFAKSLEQGAPAYNELALFGPLWQVKIDPVKSPEDAVWRSKDVGNNPGYNIKDVVIVAPKIEHPYEKPNIDLKPYKKLPPLPIIFSANDLKDNSQPPVRKQSPLPVPEIGAEGLVVNYGNKDNRDWLFDNVLASNVVRKENHLKDLNDLEETAFLLSMYNSRNNIPSVGSLNPIYNMTVSHTPAYLNGIYGNGGNLYPDGGSKNGPDWHSLYPGIKYNTDLNSIKNDPLFSINELGEVIYPSFDKWANSNKWDDIAPSYMSLGYDKPMTYGELYDNMASTYGLYNTALRIADRKAHPEKYIGDLHNYINSERHRQGLSSLGDNGVALFLDSGIRGLVNMAGTAVQAPLELGKTFMAPGTYIPYYGAIDKRMQPVYDNVDTAVGGVFSAMNPFNYVDWGSAGMEGPHTKWFWQPNSNNVETPAAIEAAGFAAMPYVAEGLGMAGKYISDIHKGRSLTARPWGKLANFNNWMETDFPKYFIVEDVVPRIANKISLELNIPLKEDALNYMKKEISDYIDNIPVEYKEMDALGSAGEEGIAYKKGIIPTILTKIHEIMHRVRHGYIEDELAETMPSDVNGKSRYDVWNNDRGQINPERDEIYNNGITALEADILNDAYTFSKEYIENNPDTHLLREKASTNSELRSAISEKASREKKHVVIGSELDAYIDALSNRLLFEIMNTLNSAYMQDWLSLVKNRRTSNLNTSFDLFPEEARKVGRHELAKKYNDRFFSAPVKKALKEVGGYALPLTIGNLLIGNNDQKAYGGNLFAYGGEDDLLSWMVNRTNSTYDPRTGYTVQFAQTDKNSGRDYQAIGLPNIPVYGQSPNPKARYINQLADQISRQQGVGNNNDYFRMVNIITDAMKDPGNIGSNGELNQLGWAQVALQQIAGPGSHLDNRKKEAAGEIFNTGLQLAMLPSIVGGLVAAPTATAVGLAGMTAGSLAGAYIGSKFDDPYSGKHYGEEIGGLLGGIAGGGIGLYGKAARGITNGVDYTLGKLGNRRAASRLVGRKLGQLADKWDGYTVSINAMNDPASFYRWGSLPEIKSMLDLGFNVTSRDVDIHPTMSNNFRESVISNKLKPGTGENEGYWIKPKPEEGAGTQKKTKFLILKTGSAHGDRTLASLGKPWEGSIANTLGFVPYLIEGRAPQIVDYGVNRSNFKPFSIEQIPIGGRVGFKTGQMPMEGLSMYKVINGDMGLLGYEGPILPNKVIPYKPRVRFSFQSQPRLVPEDTYPLYTGPRFSIGEVVNLDGIINPWNARHVQHTVADHFGKDFFSGRQAFRMEGRVENPKWHIKDPTTYDHTKYVTESAQQLPTPEGVTKQELIAAALGHDFGKMVAGDGHATIGADLVQQVFPDVSENVTQAIAEHMSSNPSTALGQVTKAADIINGSSLEKLLKYNSELYKIIMNLMNKRL